MKKIHLTLILSSLLLASCGDGNVEKIAPPVTPDAVVYTGEKAVKVRKETIIELLAIKKGIHRTIAENRKEFAPERLISDLESMRPRLEYVQMQTSMLPKQEQMIVRGNLAVATNQLEKELLAMLEKQPGNDDLAVEIANVRRQLSPIPLRSMVDRGAR